MNGRSSEPRRLVILWISAAILLAAAIALAGREERSHLQIAVRAAAAQADVLAGSVTAVLAFDDKQAMGEYLDALMRNPQVEAAGIYGVDGRPLAVLSRSGATPLPAVVAMPETSQSQGRITVVRRVTQQGQMLGFVYLATVPETPAAVVGRNMDIVLLTALALGLLGFMTRAAGRLQHANARLSEEVKARAAAEEALQQSQKLEALGQLTGGIAHDFNNLLQAIHGAFELIIGKASDEKTVSRWARNGLEAAERGATLTRQLLAFSRQQKLELKPVIVAEAVQAMRDLLARTVGPKVEVVFDLSPGRMPVMSDATQLELALMNLAVNARDAMPKGGRLTLRCRHVELTDDAVLPPGRYLQLQVIDTGEGMPLDVARRAFDPFFTTKALGKGTGLGLAQVYGVARQAGGDARITSLPGGGTTVTMLLREASQTAPEGASVVEARPAPVIQSATVLLVDDDEAVRGVVRGGLEMHGFKVLDADCGEAALAVAGESPPQIAVIDYAMPGMDGAQTAEGLRRLFPKLPIILASGHADTAAVERALGGAATVLRKPFDIDALSAMLAALLSGGAGAATP